jgi:hypothetical protein
VRLTPSELSSHMGSHSKDEIVTELIRKTTYGAPPVDLFSPLGVSASSARPLSSVQGGSSGGPALLMPQMLSLMQVMSPCFIPQPHGAPPLLVNMPSYVYPNMMNGAGMGAINGLLGAALAANFGGSHAMQQALPPAHVPHIMFPTHPLPQQPSPVTPAALFSRRWRRQRGDCPE